MAGVEKRTLSGHSDEVTSCSFSPDGASVLSGSYDKTLKIWDAATGACLGGALSLCLIIETSAEWFQSVYSWSHGSF